jgi:predicted porin
MKKSLLALAALTAFVGAASAQSSVTLFGIVDVSARNLSAGGVSQQQLATDGYNSSRLGFRGVEDLGGGMRASFWYEGSISADTGTSAGQTWQRRQTVSLSGGFGEIRAGRDYTPSFWNSTVFDPFGTNGVGSYLNVAQTSLGTGATTYVRANNSIGYFLPGGLGGLYGQVMVAAGEGLAANDYKGFRLGYGAGPMNVAFSYGKTDTTIIGAYKHVSFGGSFKLGAPTLMAQYNKVDAGSRGQKNMLIGFSYPMGATEIRGAYTKADATGSIAANDATQMAVGFVQNMSKRTALYGTYARVSNKGASTFVNGGGLSLGLRTGFNSTGYEVGVRHSF